MSDGPIFLISDSEDEAPVKAKNNPPLQVGKLGLQNKGLKRLRKVTKSPSVEDLEPPPKRHGQLFFSSSQQEEPKQNGKNESAPKGSLMAFLNSGQNEKPQSPTRIPSRAKRKAEEELWSFKYAPKSGTDLVVHKKKLDSLREFFDSHNGNLTAGIPNLLLISGPPGSGKTISVRLIASDLDFEIIEWEAPVPTLWSEHVLQGDREQQYTSKLDAFDSFVAHAKLAPLALTSSSQSNFPSKKGRKVILVDDLPHAAGADQRKQLVSAISSLANSARCPVVVIMTNSLSAAERKFSGQGVTHLLQSELSKIVEASRGMEIPFNAIPSLTGSKVLLNIADSEGLSLSSHQAKLMVESSSGDLLNAIETLQLYGQGKLDPVLAMNRKKKGKKGKGKNARKSTGMTQQDKEDMSHLQRDKNLGTFHALGRLLYNKREGDSGIESQNGPNRIQGDKLGILSKGEQAHINISLMFERREMVYDPEEVVLASGMDANPILGFLQENYLDFIREDAIEDLASASDYLSSAGKTLSKTILTKYWHSDEVLPLMDVESKEKLLTSDSMMSSANLEVETAAGHSLRDVCGVSVGSRGFMWANQHPAPKKWLPLKASQLGVVSKALLANIEELKIDWSGESSRQLAIGTLPYLRLLTSFSIASHLRPLLPLRWARVWEGTLTIEPQRNPDLQDLTNEFESMNPLQDTIEDSDSDL